MHIILYKNIKFYALNQSKSKLLVAPNIPLNIKKLGHFSAIL